MREVHHAVQGDTYTAEPSAPPWLPPSLLPTVSEFLGIAESTIVLCGSADAASVRFQKRGLTMFYENAERLERPRL